MSSYREEYWPRRPNGDGQLSPAEFEKRRQLALDRLTEAFASDFINMDSYENRVAIVQRANLPEEIDDAVAGIPQVKAEAQKGFPFAMHKAPAEPSIANRIDPGLRGEDSVACIMGSRVLQGDWLSGNKVSIFNLMGSTRIDLRDTALPPGRLKIDAFCLMGDIKVIVPPGLAVRVSALPIMGNSHIDRSVNRRVDRGAPYVEVSGLTLMGNLTVVTA